jgi:hypothetical protein
MARQLPPVAAVVVGLGCALMGTFIVLLGLGALGEPPLADGVPAWVGVLGGVVFVLGGAALIVGYVVAGGATADGDLPPGTPFSVRLVQYLLGLGITMSLASIASWVAFGPGPRQFGGSGTFGGGAVSETLGRAVFGLGAGLTWLFVITLGVVGLRRLGRR